MDIKFLVTLFQESRDAFPQKSKSQTDISDRFLFNLVLKASSAGDSQLPEAMYSCAQPSLVLELLLTA